jgi:hypothetical protein
MKKTLVFHPKDVTTDMLSYVYKNKDYTVLTNPEITEEEIKSAIEAHDKIIFLGHGLPEGFLRTSKFVLHKKAKDFFLIDDSHAHLLKDKETISIWCFSDRYFKRHGMKGFHTGMIISEVKEAYYILGSCPLSEGQVYANMINFAKHLSECIEMTPLQMQAYMLKHYTGDDPITQYNRNNFTVLE